MGYGYESQTEQEKRAFQQKMNLDTRESYYPSSQLQDTYLKENFDQRKRKIKDSIAIVKKSEKKDSLGSRMISYINGNIRKSSWLTRQKVPSKAVLDDQMDKARETFSLSTISNSQRTKRGKKFAEKAVLQAQATNALNQCISEREEALDAIMKHGMNTHLGWNKITDPRLHFHQEGDGYGLMHDINNPEFLSDVNEDSNVENLGTMLKDYAYYEGMKEGFTDQSMEFSGKKAIDAVERMANPTTRRDEYKAFLQQLDELDLSQFDYSSNEEFFKSEGPRSFAHRYSALRAFSHADRMLELVKNDFSMEGKYENLKAKTVLINEILTDYEMRSSMIQSPYYTLLAGKDFQNLSNDDLKERIRHSDDGSIKLYLEAVIRKRQMTNGFGMGKKTKDILKQKQKEMQKKGTLPGIDTSERALDNYLANQAHPRTLPAGTKLFIQPFIKDTDASPEESEMIDKLKKATLTLQIDLTKENPYRVDESDHYYYQMVDKATYSSMTDCLRQLEYYRAKFEALEDYELSAKGRQAEEIRDYKRAIHRSDGYQHTLRDYIEVIKKLREELNEMFIRDQRKELLLTPSEIDL